MTLKKIKIISVFGIFILTVLFHFLYEWFPNPIFAILFPVNESIWEHMKLLYSGFLFWGIIEYFLLKKYNLKVSNYISSLFLTLIITIIIYLIIYLPIYNAIGESIIVSISLLVITIIVGVILNYCLQINRKDDNALSIAALVLILLGYVVLASLTYNPIKNYIFYDSHNKVYGIDNK